MSASVSHSVCAPAADIAAATRGAWQRLFNAGQFDQLAGMYTTNAMLFGSSPELMNGQGGVKGYFAQLSSDVKVQMGAHKAAQIAPGVISDAGYVDFTVNGKVLPFRLSVVLVADGDRWLIAQHHGSPRGVPAG